MDRQHLPTHLKPTVVSACLLEAYSEPLSAHLRPAVVAVLRTATATFFEKLVLRI